MDGLNNDNKEAHHAGQLTLSSIPEEIQLRIFDFCTIQSLIRFGRTSRAWHDLIFDLSQDHRIFAPKTDHPTGAKDLGFLDRSSTSFTHYYTNYTNVSSWRDLCRCQVLLGRSWGREAPTVRTSLIAPRRYNDAAPFGTASLLNPARIPVWRFRPDFERRIVLATTQHGGLLVTDMDSGSLLWSLHRHEVRAYAHLEYSNGHCAFDRYGNFIEIWRHVDGEEGKRGSFEKVADLAHDAETRGFQMLWPTLCVVSTDEKGFVWDLSAKGGPHMINEMAIAGNVVGHIEQSPNDTVMYCMGRRGYHFHSKETGKMQGQLDPCSFKARGVYNVSHRHGDTLRRSILSKHEPLPPPFPPRRPHASHNPMKLPLNAGSNLNREARLAGIDDDEWGAGLIRDKMMVGISKGGRMMLCLDWPSAIKSSKRASEVTFLIELEIDAATYDFGGWLGVRLGSPGPTRIICEVDDKVYVMRLKTDLSGLLSGDEQLTDAMDVLALPSSCAPNVGVPISFMGVYDDCIMHTCLMGIGSQACPSTMGREPYIAKAIKVVSFAPAPDEMGMDSWTDEDERSGILFGNGRTTERLLRRAERTQNDDDEWEEIDLRRFQPE